MLVAAGVVLTAIASSKLQRHEQPIEKAERKVKAGMAILTISWVVLVGWTGLAFLGPRRTSSVARQGTLVSYIFAVRALHFGPRGEGEGGY